jgi:3-dehydroquinate dehydratase I
MVLVCAAVMEADLGRAVKAAGRLACDMVEVRLDGLRDRSDLGLLGRVRKPLLVTCMPKWEGGFFRGSEEDRARVLGDALEYADFVSVELRMRKGLRDGLVRAAKRRGVKVIIGYHDFKKTPSAKVIAGILERQEDAGADVAKVAFMPKCRADVVAVLAAQASANVRIPVVAISMGALGKVTRIAGPMMGGFIAFASVGKGTAAGQFTVDEMARVGGVLWR